MFFECVCFVCVFFCVSEKCVRVCFGTGQMYRCVWAGWIHSFFFIFSEKPDSAQSQSAVTLGVGQSDREWAETVTNV